MPDTKDFTALFNRLRSLMAPYGAGLVVVRDEPGDYYVETRWVRDDGYHGFVGGVQTRARYVSYHLVPVYVWPDLLDGSSAQLLRRKQGKSCLNFTALDDAMATELGDLTRRGHERMRGSGAEAFPPPRWSLPAPT